MSYKGKNIANSYQMRWRMDDIAKEYMMKKVDEHLAAGKPTKELDVKELSKEAFAFAMTMCDVREKIVLAAKEAEKAKLDLMGELAEKIHSGQLSLDAVQQLIHENQPAEGENGNGNADALNPSVGNLPWGGFNKGG